MQFCWAKNTLRVVTNMRGVSESFFISACLRVSERIKRTSYKCHVLFLEGNSNVIGEEVDRYERYGV
jgi:hypothetical protein